MRSLFLLSSLVAIAACADHNQLTSPLAGSTAAGAQHNVAATPLDASKAQPAGAKPTDQVGFTKVEMVVGTPTDITAGVFDSAYAFCPQGSSAVGGGFYGGNVTGTPPSISSTGRPIVGSQTGWGITFDNRAAGSTTFKITAWVTCVS